MDMVDRQSFALGITYTLFRRKWLMLSTFFTVFGLFLFAGYLVTPTWTAEVLLLAEQPVQPRITPFGNPGTGPVGGADVSQNLAMMLSGKGLSYDIVKQFKLDERERQSAQDPQTFRQKAKLALVKIMTFPMVELPIMLGLKERGQVDWVDKAAEDFREGLLSWLDVKAEQDSQVVSVKINGETPQLATDIANALIVRARERLAEASARASADSRAAYKAGLDAAKVRMDAANAKLQAFQEAHKGVALDDDARVKTQTYSALATDMMRLDSEIRVLNSAVTNARANAARIMLINSDRLAANEVVRSLRQSVHAQEVRLASLMKERTAQHPDVQTLGTEIARQRAALLAEIESVLQGLVAERARARGQMDALEKELLALPATQIVLAELTMAADVQRQLYQSQYAAYEEVEALARSGLALIEFKVLDDAYVSPLASSDMPSWLIIIVVGGVMGVGAALALALFIEYWRDPIKSPVDLRRHRIDVLAVIP